MESTGLATASTAEFFLYVAVEGKEKVGWHVCPLTVGPINSSLEASTECAAPPSVFTTFSPEAILSTAVTAAFPFFNGASTTGPTTLEMLFPIRLRWG